MISKELLKELKVTQAITPTAGAAGQTDIEGATLDMANFLGFMVEVTFGAITSGAVTGLTIEQSDNSNMSSAETVYSRTIADDDDGEVHVVDVFKPNKRYCRVHIDRGTQNAVVAGATYYQYGPRVSPVASHGSAVVAASAVSPDAVS